jgi:hypothetical protein
MTDMSVSKNYFALPPNKDINVMVDKVLVVPFSVNNYPLGTYSHTR